MSSRKHVLEHIIYNKIYLSLTNNPNNYNNNNN